MLRTLNTCVVVSLLSLCFGCAEPATCPSGLPTDAQVTAAQHNRQDAQALAIQTTLESLERQKARYSALMTELNCLNQEMQATSRELEALKAAFPAVVEQTLQGELKPVPENNAPWYSLKRWTGKKQQKFALPETPTPVVAPKAVAVPALVPGTVNTPAVAVPAVIIPNK